jgi:hypothetical protein
MDDQQTDQPDVAAVDGYAQMQVDTLLNLASPQPMYRATTSCSRRASTCRSATCDR